MTQNIEDLTEDKDIVEEQLHESQESFSLLTKEFENLQNQLQEIKLTRMITDDPVVKLDRLKTATESSNDVLVSTDEKSIQTEDVVFEKTKPSSSTVNKQSQPLSSGNQSTAKGIPPRNIAKNSTRARNVVSRSQTTATPGSASSIISTASGKQSIRRTESASIDSRTSSYEDNKSVKSSNKSILSATKSVLSSKAKNSVSASRAQAQAAQRGTDTTTTTTTTTTATAGGEGKGGEGKGGGVRGSGSRPGRAGSEASGGSTSRGGGGGGGGGVNKKKLVGPNTYEREPDDISSAGSLFSSDKPESMVMLPQVIMTSACSNLLPDEELSDGDESDVISILSQSNRQQRSPSRSARPVESGDQSPQRRGSAASSRSGKGSVSSQQRSRAGKSSTKPPEAMVGL